MAGSSLLLPGAAIAAYGEGRIEGRRVLLVGSAVHKLWEKLLERGARLVHVCDPDPVRLAEAAARNTASSVSFAPLSNQASLALRDGVFDLAIVDNLASLDEPATTLRLVRRAVAPRGIAFVTAPNPDTRESLLADMTPLRHTLDYYSLYDLVREQFPVVRMLGQMPFVGYTMAELAPLDDPEPTLDAGFVPGGTEEPEWFVAAASAQPFDIESFFLVQFPVSEVLHHSSERQLRDQLRASRNAERSAVERLARLEARHVEAAAKAAAAEHDAESARQVSELRAELARREALAASFEARTVVAEANLADARQQIEQLQQRLAAAEQLAAPPAPSEQPSGADQVAVDAAADIERLESQLRERGERLRELEAQLKSVERVGHQLLRDLQAARQGQDQRFGTHAWSASASAPLHAESAPADTSQSPDKTSAWVSRQADDETTLGADEPSIADEHARLQADVLAATWRIEQLLSILKRHRDTESELAQVAQQLGHAQSRLNEQAVLIHQLKSNAIRD